MLDDVWCRVIGDELAQGDYILSCGVPVAGPDFGADASGEEDVEVEERDLIIITQSCDLANDRTLFAALCPIVTLAEFQDANPEFGQKGRWELVRKGRVEGLHMLPSTRDPTDNHSALVVDFRQIFSLPVRYLKRQASSSGDRQRLKSPYLEHFSQSFARFFMRVGLPLAIPPFK